MSGGLGNQFFSYAAAYQCCKEHHYRLALDTSTQEATWFFRNYDLQHYAIELDEKVTYRIGDGLWDHLLLNHLCRRRAIGFFTPVLYEDKTTYHPEVFEPLKKGTHYIIGDWQRLPYIDRYPKDLQRMFTYQKELSKGAKAWADRIRMSNESVAVHARRGDYVALNATLSAQYFIAAIEVMGKTLKHPTFYCFSEDLNWLREALLPLHEKYEFVYVNYNSQEKGIEDFELMRMCRHQIVANSTYSWWAAYLNTNPHKTVIHPKTDKTEYWPEEWIALEK